MRRTTKDRFEELYSLLKENVDDPTQSWGDEFDELLDIYNALKKQIVNQMDSIDKLLKENEVLKGDLKNIKEQREFYEKENEKLKAEILLQNNDIEGLEEKLSEASEKLKSSEEWQG